MVSCAAAEPKGTSGHHDLEPVTACLAESDFVALIEDEGLFDPVDESNTPTPPGRPASEHISIRRDI
jgi:hypothetical protein